MAHSGGFEPPTARFVAPSQAITVKADEAAAICISNPSHEPVHFSLFDGAQIDETYVQDGPFVMGSEEQIANIKAAYKAGQLGSIPGNHLAKLT